MNTANPTATTIMVGVDGSAGAEQALRWAVRVATERRLGLHIVHAVRVAELYYGGAYAGSGAVLEVMREEGTRILDEAVALARSIDADLTISTSMPTESPVPLLIDLSREARMLVIGHTGTGGFAGMLLGSTAAAVAAHAHCPVAVIRGRLETSEVPQTGPVVVGIDGSPVSEDAIAIAFEEASLRGAPLVAVHAWSDVTYDVYGIERLANEWPAIEDREERALAERLAGWQEKYPDVEVHRELARDRPTHALLDQAEKAQLVVVGSRGRGGFRGLLLGSTSQALLRHAQSPVLVVRSEPGR